MSNIEFKFGTLSIFELGNMISQKLKEDGITEKAKLYVYLNDNEFKKVDEDLYYRNKSDDSEKFMPSEEEIDVSLDGINVIIKKK